MMTPQTIEIVKGLAALLFFFLALLVTVYLAKKKVIGAKLTGTLLMGMMAIMAVLLGVAIDWKRLTVSELNSGVREGENLRAYGLSIKSIESQQEYLADGDFRVEYTYEVRNVSSVHVTELLPDKGGWFGKKIKYELTGRILGDKAGFYTLDLSRVSEAEWETEYVEGSNVALTYLQWQPRVKPPLGPNEILRYAVTISTWGTEKAAFTRGGSYAGIGTTYVVDRLSCLIKAPQGKQFLPSGFVIRDMSGHTLDKSMVDRQPEFENDNTEISWTIDKPLPCVNYLLRIKIVERNY